MIKALTGLLGWFEETNSAVWLDQS